MKKILFPAAFIFLLSSCKKEVNIDAVIGENTIEEGQCLINIKNQQITVCFNKLEQDSRCPLNAICFWQGIAVAEFTLTQGQTTASFNLTTFKFSGYTNDTTINGVRIRLKDVSPYPGENGYKLKKKKVILHIQ